MATTQLPDLDRSTGVRAWRRDLAALGRAIDTRDTKIRHYHQQGYPVPDLMAAFALSRSRIYQILNLSGGTQ